MLNGLGAELDAGALAPALPSPRAPWRRRAWAWVAGSAWAASRPAAAVPAAAARRRSGRGGRRAEPRLPATAADASRQAMATARVAWARARAVRSAWPGRCRRRAKRSLRITAATDRTRTHSRTRNPIWISLSESGLTGHPPYRKTMVSEPMPTRAPSYSSADWTRSPSRKVPLVEPRSFTRGGSDSTISRVPARDARVVQAQVGVGAAAEHRVPVRERQGRAARSPAPPTPRRVRRGTAGGLGAVDAAGDRLAADPEDAGVEVLDQLEAATVTGADELVPLLVGVLAHHRGELGAQRLGVHRRGVRSRAAPSSTMKSLGTIVRPRVDDRGPVVALALQRRGDLDGLDLGLERPRERAADDAVEAPLEAVHDAHGHLLGRRRSRLRRRLVGTRRARCQGNRAATIFGPRAARRCVRTLAALARVAE